MTLEALLRHPALGAATAPGRRVASRIGRLGGGPQRAGIGREVLLFAGIGVVSTAAYAGLYLLLRTALGPSASNGVALLVTSIGNTAANRRLTFGVHGRGSMAHDLAGGFVALGVALAITTGAVKGLDAVDPTAGRLLELAALVAANGLATAARFVVLRRWIARRR